MNGSARQALSYLGNLGSALPAAISQHRGNFFWKRASGSEDELYAGVKDSSGVNQLRRILTKTYADTLYTSASLTAISFTLGPFFAFNTGTSVTEQMGIMESSAIAVQRITVDDYYMARAGRVVGMMLISSEDRTAGSVTGRVYLDGVATTFASGTCVLEATNPHRHSVIVAPADGVAFTAGQRVGMGVTTSGTWAPTTADFNGLLVVAYTPF